MAFCMSAMTDFLEKLESEHVTVSVGQGDSAKRFSIPKDLLGLRSQWFENALKADRFKEGSAGEIELPEDDTDVFQAFLFFLHTGELAFPSKLYTSEQRGSNLLLCFRIWCFGDKYCLSRLQNAALHRACLVLDERYHPQDIDAACLGECFHVGIDHAPLRVLIADHYVKLIEEKGPEVEIDSSLGSCPRFLVELHASEASFHELAAGDFPRYLKPTKNADLLYVGPAESRCWYGGDFLEADGRWKEPMSTCSDCGFEMDDVEPYSKECQTQHCKCGTRDWFFLCPDCRPD